MYIAEEDGWAGRLRPVFPFLLVALLGCTSVAPAHALFKKKKKQPETLDQFSGRLVKLYWPIMANLGFSGGIGLACGLALRVRLHPEPQKLPPSRHTVHAAGCIEDNSCLLCHSASLSHTQWVLGCMVFRQGCSAICMVPSNVCRKSHWTCPAGSWPGACNSFGDPVRRHTGKCSPSAGICHLFIPIKWCLSSGC